MLTLQKLPLCSKGAPVAITLENSNHMRVTLLSDVYKRQGQKARREILEPARFLIIIVSGRDVAVCREEAAVRCV